MPSIGVYGPSGSGKSTAIRPPKTSGNPSPIGLDPKETFIICPDLKDLPFRGSKTLFPQVYNPDGSIDLGSSRFFTQDKTVKVDKTEVVRMATNAKVVLGIMRALEKDETIKNGVLDTLNHIITHGFLKKSKDLGYEKFNQIADEVYDIINFARSSRINWFILMHSDEVYDKEGDLRTKVRTVGKLLDEKIEIPSYFTIVVSPDKEVEEKTGEVTHFFRTRTNGKDVVKSPYGMFEPRIPNDFGLLLKQMEEYQNTPE